jgi:hypothetical protein
VTDSLGKPAVAPVSHVSAHEASLAYEAADPVTLPEADEAPQRQDDITWESTEAIAGEESRSYEVIAPDTSSEDFEIACCSSS